LNEHLQRKARLRREWLLTAAIAFALLGLFVYGSVARPMGNVVYDHFMRLHGFRATQDIVIVAIDDRSLKELGGWPLKRSNYQALLDQLNDERYKPKSIGIDLLFLDPTADDTALAQSIRQHKAVLPLEFKIQDDAKQTYQASPPIGPLADAAELGHINLAFDGDGIIRGFNAKDKHWPHFALAMHAQGEPQTHVNASERPQRFRMVDPRVGFPMVSLVDAIHNDFTKALLKDKYVLVGVTAPSLSDRYPTLYSGKNNASTPGVAILASILNASLNHAFIQEASPLIVLGGTALLVFVMLQSLVMLKPRQSLLLALLLIALSTLLSYGLLSQADLWLDPVPFVLVALIIQPLWAWRRLEAIVHVVQNKAADLQQFQTTERNAQALKPSREVVLQYGKLLDQAVASARSELDLLTTIVDEMPDAVAIFDASDELLLCNRQLKALIGDKHLALGSNVHQVLQTLGLNIHTPSTCALPTLLGNKEFFIKNAQVPSPLGGQLRLLILTDITELRQSQIQRDRALQFLSHDMRTPVASIMSITQNEDIDKTQRQKIRHHGRALLHLMDDFILTISAEASQYTLKEELLDNLVQDAIEQVADLAQAKGIHIREDAAPSEVFVMANTRLLVRALVNLLFNAVKFSPDNSQILLNVGHNPSTQTTCITITNPVSMPAGPQDLTPSMPGFGLGLDFVDTVIRKHHGRIERVIPAQGEAHIRIELPCIS
jgi:CHASE2 domain-containing sensor protein